jgi:hypothetical protein
MVDELEISDFTICTNSYVWYLGYIIDQLQICGSHGNVKTGGYKYIFLIVA